MRLCLLKLLAVLLLAPLSVNGQDAGEIRFAKGADTGTVRGEVSKFRKTHVFRARQGQQLTATLAPESGDKGMLTMSLNKYCGEEYGAPLADDVLRWQGPLPCSDRYSIDIVPSAEAMKAGRLQRYTLTLTIR